MEVFYLFFIGCTFFTTCLAVNSNQYMNPNWIEPHAWANEKDPLMQLCPLAQECKPSELCEKTAQQEYLRLVRNLFDRSKFRFDESTGYRHRTVHIHATEEQLEKLYKLTDPDLIDGLISDILAQTSFGTLQMVKEYSVDLVNEIWKRMPSAPQLPSIDSFDFNVLPRTKQIVVNFALMLIVYVVCRRFNVNIFVGVFFVFALCLYEYLDSECHKRIEVERTLEFIYGEEKNPCLSPKKLGWYDYLLGKDSRSACREYLSKRNQPQKECGMVDLFHEFTSNVLFKQLSLFFTNLADLVQSISSTYGIIITAITLYFMKGLLTTIIYSLFKFILNPSIWSKVAADVNQSVPQQQQHQYQSETVRLQSIRDADIKDTHLSKALDLANNQIKLMLNVTSARSTMEPSRVEVLSVANDEQNSDVSIQAIVSDSKCDLTAQISSKVSESDSYEEISEEEIFVSNALTMANVMKTSGGDANDFVEISSQSCPSSLSDVNDDKLSTSSESKVANDIELLSNASDNDVVDGHNVVQSNYQKNDV